MSDGEIGAIVVAVVAFAVGIWIGGSTEEYLMKCAIKEGRVSLVTNVVSRVEVKVISR